MVEKTCKYCNEVKVLTEFRPSRLCRGGYSHRCITCDKKRQLKLYNENRQLRVAVSKEYQKKMSKVERYKEYHREYSRKYTKLTDVVKKRQERQQRLRRENIMYKIKACLRRRLHAALKHRKKTGSAVRDVGCTISELKMYLESLFKPGMTWENHGTHGWHIDHIRPLASFDLSKREELLKACHYTNLQPLWAFENLSKGDKVA